MYRILDLISEQGSGGLGKLEYLVKEPHANSHISLSVDKIIISQDSLRAFINTLCPGAYASLTKVDFKTLDNLTVKPIGIYGSRCEIVRFLSAIGAADESLWVFLTKCRNIFLRVCPGRTHCPLSKMTSPG